MFFKMFWIIEKLIFLVPTAPIKLGLGLWIMLPNFYGEFFMYNLLSDKLDIVVNIIRKYRNKFFGKITFHLFSLAHKSFDLSKEYISNDFLKAFEEGINCLSNSVKEEMILRAK
mgnify:CR=1 FL=1